MSFKSTLRRAVLLPITPQLFLRELTLVRSFGLLPRRIAGQWPPKRVLIVNITGYLGDALMTLPLVDALRRALPQCEVDLIVETSMAAPLRHVSSLTQVYGFSPRKLNLPALGAYLRVYDMVRFAQSELANRAYDLVLLPRWGTDASLSHYLAAMTSAPRICGHDPDEEIAAEQVFPNLTKLLTLVSHGGLGMAEGVRQQLLLIAAGITHELDPSKEEFRVVQGVLDIGRQVRPETLVAKLRLSMDQPFVLLAPGASHPARRWPAERFAQLGRLIYDKTGFSVSVIGAPADVPLGDAIRDLSSGLITNLAGQTSIPETVALVSRAALLVTNDSGPAHIGGGVGTPTVVLSVCPETSTREHANSPRRVRPVGPNVTVIQPEVPAPGCSDRCLEASAHCITGIQVETVATAAIRCLAALSRPKMEWDAVADLPIRSSSF